MPGSTGPVERNNPPVASCGDSVTSATQPDENTNGHRRKPMAAVVAMMSGAYLGGGPPGGPDPGGPNPGGPPPPFRISRCSRWQAMHEPASLPWASRAASLDLAWAA